MNDAMKPAEKSQKSDKDDGGGDRVTLGAVWGIGWMFTLGIAHLGFGKALLALMIWPVMLGSSLSP